LIYRREPSSRREMALYLLSKCTHTLEIVKRAKDPLVRWKYPEG